MTVPMAHTAKTARPITNVLVANRGEIAARILRACREARLRSVAVYSEADREAPYLTIADQAVCIGPAPASESYLDAERILLAAQEAGADAIHPGYGFLSENADFAALCAERGVTFVGPSADVIRALGDKAGAKILASKAGVPVVPGYYGTDQTDGRLMKEAESIGAPVLIKATAGGGGRGMRAVHDLAEFPALLQEARREAKAAFGNDAVLLERYLVNPRHIEFQIFGDAQGRVFALHERECSIQRRHQKIIEESPSPALDEATRARMADAAVKIGQAAGYRSAGTVEFLLAEDKTGGEPQFFFLEVNTRLQVEHPVTELRTGLDLVKLQLEVAAGLPTPGLTDPIPAAGHAIEARIYAEDPACGFAPSLGTLLHWKEPRGQNVRVDSGVATGSEVSPYYDSMLAKLIVYGHSRDEALHRLETALLDFQVLGVTTNIPYLLAIVRHQQFRAGDTHVRFLDEYFPNWLPAPSIPEEVLMAYAAVELSRKGSRPGASASATSINHGSQIESPWRDGGAWRNV